MSQYSMNVYEQRKMRKRGREKDGYRGRGRIMRELERERGDTEREVED